jgi:hypothetical protein
VDAKIKVNGQEYDHPDQMPPEVRRLYQAAIALGGPMFADRDGNGIPDVIEGKGGAIAAMPGRSLIVNGRTYKSADEMPPEDRRTYQQAVETARAAGSGVNVSFTTFAMPFSFRWRPKTGPASPATPSPIEPTGFEAGIRTLVAVVALVALAAAGWLWMVRR